jgi:DnaK suppressor protein
MLKKTFLKKIKEQLVLERNELMGKSIRRPDIDTDGDETDEIQGNMLIDLHNQMSVRNNVKLLQINDAIKKIDENRYGMCEDCEENIPEKRLVINPYFLTCVSCAEERETEDKQRKRL